MEYLDEVDFEESEDDIEDLELTQIDKRPSSSEGESEFQSLPLTLL